MGDFDCCTTPQGHQVLPTGPTTPATISPLPADAEPLRHKHWLIFNNRSEVTGCHCGFIADSDDCGYGDSVTIHLFAVARAAERERIAARVRATHENAHGPNVAIEHCRRPSCAIASLFIDLVEALDAH